VKSEWWLFRDLSDAMKVMLSSCYRRHELIITMECFLVNNDFAMKLRGLEGYEIVFICDDSGSMTKPIG
jgi:hypothetical protein